MDHVRIIKSKYSTNTNFGLYPGTWCSFNNQNTSTNRDLSSVYFTPSSAGRNSDIWTSYVICKLTEVSGDIVAFGAPYVKQFRNKHDLWIDLKDELQNNMLTDFFVDLIKNIKIIKSNYIDMLLQLINKSLSILENNDTLSSADKQYIKNYFLEYKIWAEYFK